MYLMLPTPDWGSKKTAEAAAKEKETLARLMGYVTLEYTNVSPDTMTKGNIDDGAIPRYKWV